MQIVMYADEIDKILTKYVAEQMRCSGTGKLAKDTFLFEIEAPKVCPIEEPDVEEKPEAPVKETQAEVVSKLDAKLVEPEKEEAVEPISEQPAQTQPTHSLFSRLKKPEN